MKMKSTLAAGALFAVSISSASAATYQHTVNNGIFGNGGTFDQLQTSYDTNTEQLNWSLTNGKIGTDAVTGFWLVLNDGPNPKSTDVNELAILYADLSANKLLAYTYNGLNNSNSINNPGIFIGDYSTDLTVSANEFSFSIDASAINAFTHPDVVATDWKACNMTMSSAFGSMLPLITQSLVTVLNHLITS